MFTGYFDDSGGADHGFTTVCGWTASLEEWRRFAEQWRTLLAMAKIPYFTMKHCAHWKGPFEPWKRDPDVRARFLEVACRIIQENVRYGFASVVDHEAYEKVNLSYTLREWTKSPYALAGFTCARSLNAWARGNYPKEPFEVVYEDGTDGQGGLIDLMRAELGLMPIFRPSRPMGRVPAVVQLQAADFLAYEVRKVKVDDPDELRPIEKHRKSLLGLISEASNWVQYTEDDLIQTCEAHPKIQKRH
jgi:hypothetical protein